MLYLAMTAAEIAENPALPPFPAWMACHFSPYGTGLSNVPAQLPEGSMLILNDRTPIMGHDAELVAKQLCQAAKSFKCSRLLLDFQRPGQDLFPVIQKVLETAPCPAGVSSLYAQALSCPVFLPVLPLLTPLQEYLAPWKEREIWLEVGLDAQRVTVTEAGSTAFPCPTPASLPHFDTELGIHYGLRLTDTSAEFTLSRGWEDIQKLMENGGISCFVGLYQELKNAGV